MGATDTSKRKRQLDPGCKVVFGAPDITWDDLEGFLRGRGQLQTPDGREIDERMFTVHMVRELVVTTDLSRLEYTSMLVNGTARIELDSGKLSLLSGRLRDWLLARNYTIDIDTWLLIAEQPPKSLRWFKDMLEDPANEKLRLGWKACDFSTAIVYSPVAALVKLNTNGAPPDQNPY
jgi:hypothetical protein